MDIMIQMIIHMMQSYYNYNTFNLKDQCNNIHNNFINITMNHYQLNICMMYLYNLINLIKHFHNINLYNICLLHQKSIILMYYLNKYINYNHLLHFIIQYNCITIINNINQYNFQMNFILLIHLNNLIHIQFHYIHDINKFSYIYH